LWRPVLLVPEGIEDHLTQRQLDAVLAHELCHVRRCDNARAAVHMLVEAVFWFHPLVWWIGARLVEERERACDEEVLRLGGDPQVYAEGILNVCKRYAEAPLACVSGVSGSDLRRRIESIILGTPGRPLTFGKRLVLGGTATAVFALPLMAGALQVPVSPGEAVDPDLRFEVASIKPHDASSGVVLMRTLPGRFEALNVLVRQLLPQALLMPEDRIVPDARIIGAPNWVDSERYTINAKLPAGAPQSGVSVMLTNLLKDRFKLATHTETRELPVFHLVLARSDGRLGPNLKESSAECQAMIASSGGGPGGADTRPALLPGTPGGPPLFDPVTKPCGSGRSGPGILGGGGYPISWLVQKLSELTRRPVIDKTGLGGLYDFALTFASEPGMYRIPGGMPLPPMPATATDPDAPSLSTALLEQLGLKLENQRGPVDVVVIDRLERPTPD